MLDSLYDHAGGNSFSSFNRRQKEAEQKSIEDAANKRIEELVAKRVAEELERRREEIEAEVLRRVEEAKAVMEKQMLEEIERRKQEQIEEARKREVRVKRGRSYHHRAVRQSQRQTRYITSSGVASSRHSLEYYVNIARNYHAFLRPRAGRGFATHYPHPSCERLRLG